MRLFKSGIIAGTILIMLMACSGEGETGGSGEDGETADASGDRFSLESLPEIQPGEDGELRTLNLDFDYENALTMEEFNDQFSEFGKLFFIETDGASKNGAVYDDGVIYLFGDDFVRAVEEDTNEELWQVDLGFRYTAMHQPLYSYGEDAFLFIEYDGNPTNEYKVVNKDGTIRYEGTLDEVSSISQVYLFPEDDTIYFFDRAVELFEAAFDSDLEHESYYFKYNFENEELTRLEVPPVHSDSGHSGNYTFVNKELIRIIDSNLEKYNGETFELDWSLEGERNWYSVMTQNHDGSEEVYILNRYEEVTRVHDLSTGEVLREYPMDGDYRYSNQIGSGFRFGNMVYVEDQTRRGMGYGFFNLEEGTQTLNFREDINRAVQWNDGRFHYSFGRIRDAETEEMQMVFLAYDIHTEEHIASVIMPEYFSEIDNTRHYLNNDIFLAKEDIAIGFVRN
ncbi:MULTISPECIES: hypothetical protein [Bacillaceae]|uniref:Uncharacterized protein n=1 Tax=Evansella alkalicola TaxID=745819 RepID=A0ABS6JZ56_9BACI|nr:MULTISPECIES: hypothetical protein [Bacillaceae]MBU9723868.1 hypothetical protein [Bacillus alkalicola]